MNKRIKLLALLMSFVMVLGVMVAVPLTANATVASFDVRFAYEYLLAKSYSSTSSPIENYRRVDYVPYVTGTAPVFGGGIDAENYTIVNPVTTHSYATTAAKISSKMAEDGNKSLNEYFAQDENYIYFAFEMPKYSNHTTAVFEVFYNANKAVTSSANRQISGAYWGQPLVEFTVKTDGTYAINTTEVAPNSSRDNLEMSKITTKVEDMISFVAPTTTDTNGYLEIKLPKDEFAAAEGITEKQLTDVSYILRYGSDGTHINYVSNAIDTSSEVATALFSTNNEYKQICRNIGLIDYRYSYPDVTTNITKVSAFAPNVTDAEISVGEYSTTNVVGDVTEYFAFDGDYIYLAFDTPALDSTKSIDIPIYSSAEFRAQGANTCGRTCRIAAGGDSMSSWIAGTSSATYASNSKSGFTFTNAYSVDYENGVIEFKISLKQIFAANNGTPTATEFLRPWKSLNSVDNIRYGLVCTGADGVGYSTKIKATADMNASWGIATTADVCRNLNLDIDFDDVRTDFVGTTIPSMSTTAPTVDGTINESEYTVKANSYSAYEQGSAYSGALPVVEYFAEDMTNVYFGFKLSNAKLNDTASNTTRNAELRIWASNSGAASASSGTTTIAIDEAANKKANYYSYAATEDAENHIVYVEFSVAKPYLSDTAENYDSVYDFKNLRYALYYNEYFDSDSQPRPAVCATHVTGSIAPWVNSRITGKSGGLIGKNLNLCATYPEIEDVRDLSAYGYDSLNVGFSDTALNVTDGEIDANDYTATRVVVPGYKHGTGPSTATVTEYMTHDDEWIYVAFEATRFDSTKNANITLWFVNSSFGVDAGPYCSTRFNFEPANAVDGVRPATIHGWLIGTGTDGKGLSLGEFSVQPEGTGAYTAEDYAGALTMLDDTTALIEFKISKSVLAANSSNKDATRIDVLDLNSIRMSLNYFEIDSTNTNGLHTLIHNYKNYSNRMLFEAIAANDAEAGFAFEAVATDSAVARNYNLIYTEFETSDKASARIDQAETSGLRFKTTVSKAYIAELEEQGYTVSVGTLIAPTDYIGTGEGTKYETLKHVEGGEEAKLYIDVKAYLENPYVSGTTTVTFTGAIVNIKDANLTRDFSAVGYIALTKGGETTYLYSDVVASRKISDVAAAELAAPSKDYNDTQLAILNKLAGNN